MTTADLVKRSDMQVEEAAPPEANGANNGHEPLFLQEEADNFRNRWRQIQANFVDEPRQSVEQADELVATTIKRLAEIFAGERSRMEQDWQRGQDVSTEDLRQALRRYRSFFDRLLSV